MKTNTREEIEKILVDYHYPYCQDGGCKDCKNATKKPVDQILALVEKQKKEAVEEIKSKMIIAECELPEEGKSTRKKFYHLELEKEE